MVIAAVCGLTISLSLATFITIQKKNSNEGQFNANINALAATESTVLGHCKEVSGNCMFRCSKCGSNYEAIGHKGPATNMSGVCMSCGGTI